MTTPANVLDVMDVALLNVSHAPERARENFLRVFTPIDDVEVSVYRAREGELPDPAAVDAAVVTGSADSVTDDPRYAEALREWFRATDAPILGVCFGHQLLADTFGGEVARLEDPELGYRKITIEEPDDPLFDGLPETFTAFTCHEDAVVEPPDGATVLAKNEHGVQALRRGRIASIQFHPEIEFEYARALVEEMNASPGTTEAALETLSAENYRDSLVSRAVFENFVADARRPGG